MSSIENIYQKVKDFHLLDPTGHDFFHIERVLNIALEISKNYPEADLEILELSALLHDTGDYKLNEGKSGDLWDFAKTLLEKENLPKDKIEKILFICKNISFSNPDKDIKLPLEGLILQDADRIDAIGAIGIARCFAYGGNKNRQIYNPEIEPQINQTAQQYRNNKNSTSINHFYEKLLKIKNLLNTPEAKQISEKRHIFMEEFLKMFFEEWKNKKC